MSPRNIYAFPPGICKSEMPIEDIIQQPRHEIRPRHEEKGHRHEKEEDIRLLNHGGMQHLFTEIVQMKVCRVLASLQDVPNDGNLYQEHHEHDEPGNQPHHEGQIQRPDEGRFIDRQNGQPARHHHIADGRIDEPSEMNGAPLDDVLDEEKDMQGKGELKKDKQD